MELTDDQLRLKNACKNFLQKRLSIESRGGSTNNYYLMRGMGMDVAEVAILHQFRDEVVKLKRDISVVRDALLRFALWGEESAETIIGPPSKATFEMVLNADKQILAKIETLFREVRSTADKKAVKQSDSDLVLNVMEDVTSLRVRFGAVVEAFKAAKEIDVGLG